MLELFNWLSSNVLATKIILLIFLLLVLLLVIIYLVGFFQGREISFYPPKIGPKEKNITNESANNKTRFFAKENDISGPRNIIQIEKHGFISMYVPATNITRNSRKKHVLIDAESEIKLLAITGYSFLADIGNRFKDILTQRLFDGLYVKIILLNPWTDTALLLSLEELTNETRQIQYKDIYNSINREKIVGTNPVNIIENSLYYRRNFLKSIEGYNNLKKTFGDNIDLRTYNQQIGYSLLLTEKIGFFEPYINVHLQERITKSMNTFELEFTKSSYFYTTCTYYFNKIWKTSMPYKDFLNNEKTIKTKFNLRYECKKLNE